MLLLNGNFCDFTSKSTTVSAIVPTHSPDCRPPGAMLRLALNSSALGLRSAPSPRATLNRRLIRLRDARPRLARRSRRRERLPAPRADCQRKRGRDRGRRRPRHRAPAGRSAKSLRENPAPNAAVAAPSWWAVKIQPKVRFALSAPNRSAVSRTVGGTVATQSRP